MGALTHTHVSDTSASLLSIPAELRNHIYYQLFHPPIYRAPKLHFPVQVPSLADFGRDVQYDSRDPSVIRNAALVQSCRQLHRETQFLYLSTTPFHLIGAVADPVAFANLTSHLPAGHRQAIRHIVLSAKISHLRALNETWNAVPFGHSDFFLETLTIVPRRPDTHSLAYAEVADLHQCHTLAYILAETLKGLRHVGVVVVRNEGCFNDLIWRLTYRSLVHRLWKWGGRLCDLKFRENEEEQLFEVKCSTWLDDKGKRRGVAGAGWQDVVQELQRLLGLEDDGGGMDNMI